jgi:glycosyltransferase involved in cell wall biosynthesis
MEPAVSVIVAAHRAHAFLGAALNSVLAQTLEDFEILIAPDEPADYAEFAGRDLRIRLLPPVAAPSGPGGARNRALAQARGRFLALLDSDDLISPNYLACLVPLAERHGAAFGRTTILAGGLELRSAPLATHTGPVDFGVFETAFGSVHGVTRRAHGRRWREVQSEDVLFDLETLALAGGTAPYVADAIYALHQHPDSVTRSAAFIQSAHSSYDRLIGMIESGDTDIAESFRRKAAAVFRSWQAMNTRFVTAAGAAPGLDYQRFVAEDLSRSVNLQASS